MATSGEIPAPSEAVWLAIASGSLVAFAADSPVADSAAVMSPLVFNHCMMAWISWMHEAPAAITLLWQVWSQPVHGKSVANAAGLDVSNVEGSKFVQLSGKAAAGASSALTTLKTASPAVKATRNETLMLFFIFLK